MRFTEPSMVSNCAKPSDFNESLIVSPNFRDGYRNNQNCWWKIRAEHGQIIELKIEKFKVEYSTGCLYDSLQLYDGQNSSSQTLLGRKLCGWARYIPDIFRTTGNHLYLEFRSDSTRIEPGFKIAYSFKGK